MESINEKYAQHIGSMERYPIVVMTPGVSNVIESIGCRWLIDKILGFRALHPHDWMIRVIVEGREGGEECRIVASGDEHEGWKEEEICRPENSFPEGGTS